MPTRLKWLGARIIAASANGEQFLIATNAALAHPVSRQWKGYWQRVGKQAQLDAMPIERSQVHRLRQGRDGTLFVGTLARAGVEFLRAKTVSVLISKDGLLHIDKQHDDITDFDVITMSFGLQRGLFIGDRSQPTHLIISYIYPDNSVRYKIVVKSALNGSELWISTFHRLRPRQTRTLLKRGLVIKPHA